MTDRELMQQALDMLNEIADDVYCDQKLEGVITALRQALVDADDTSQERVDETAKQRHEQEPVAHTLNCVCGAVWDVSPDGVEEMVHAPNPPQRKPLTDEQIDALVIDKDGLPNSHLEFARAIEAAHGIKEKNT